MAGRSDVEDAFAQKYHARVMDAITELYLEGVEITEIVHAPKMAKLMRGKECMYTVPRPAALIGKSIALRSKQTGKLLS